MTKEEFHAYWHPDKDCECDCHCNPYGGNPCDPIVNGEAACCTEARKLREAKLQANKSAYRTRKRY